jgi:DNA-binding MarR family transcriptional regulator
MSNSSLERAARDVREQCLGTKLRMATRAVTQHYDESMASVGLRGTQFTLLIALAQAPRVPLSKLADALVMDRTTLTRNLNPLLRDGLVEAHDAQDRRVRAYALTGRGRQLVERALPCWKKAQADMFRALSPGDRAQLTRLLDAAVAAARAD